MALPLIPIAAGVAARYGAKKLAKYLVKRNTKKSNVKAKKLEQKNFDKANAKNPFDLLYRINPVNKKLKTLRGKKRKGSYGDPEKNLKRIDRQHVEKLKKFTKKLIKQNTSRPINKVNIK